MLIGFWFRVVYSKLCICRRRRIFSNVLELCILIPKNKRILRCTTKWRFSHTHFPHFSDDSTQSEDDNNAELMKMSIGRESKRAYERNVNVNDDKPVTLVWLIAMQNGSGICALGIFDSAYAHLLHLLLQQIWVNEKQLLFIICQLTSQEGPHLQKWWWGRARFVLLLIFSFALFFF